LAAWLSQRSVEIAQTALLADEMEEIAALLAKWSDEGQYDLILTTGGTGVSPRDRTPEATRRVLHLELPGFAEAMRARSMQITPLAMLSRAVAGIRGCTLIVNLPGSPKAAIECLEAVWPALRHAVDKIRGDNADCAEIALNSVS
jgi:molybdenum cofactor synthesis domain-containing protein